MEGKILKKSIVAGVLALNVVFGMTTAFAATDSSTDKHTAQSTVSKSEKWIGAWATSQQHPHPTGISNDGFKNQTLRMIVHPHASGSEIRLKFSNVYGTKPLTLGKINVARSGEGAKTLSGTDRKITFKGKSSTTIPVGKELLSDPISFNVKEGENLTVSVYIPGNTGPTTWHSLSNQTSYYSVKGNQTNEASGKSFTKSVNSWFWLSGVDVVTKDKNARVIVTLGDSITDGDWSTLNANTRYPDYLADFLDKTFKQEVSVLNAGISGNRILHDLPQNGESALKRLNRDVLSQTGVTDVILLEGINDIAKMPHNYNHTQIINGMKKIAKEAHKKGLRIYVGTLTPFRDASYLQYDWTFTEQGEETREKVNAWIRSNKDFDGVIDFEKAIANPQDPDRMLPVYDSGDHIHPNSTGYQAMANAIDLSVFKASSKVKH